MDKKHLVQELKRYSEMDAGALISSLAKKYWKPALALAVLVAVTTVTVKSIQHSRAVVRQEAEEAKALYESTDTVELQRYFDDKSELPFRVWSVEDDCYYELAKKYDDWEVVKVTYATNSAIVGGRNVQADMDATTRAALAMGATRGQHTEMLRETILESAYSGRRRQYVSCSVTIAHMTKRNPDKRSTAGERDARKAENRYHDEVAALAKKAEAKP